MTNEAKTPVDLIQDSDHPDVVATFARVGGATGIGNIHRVVANSPTVFANYIGFVYSLRHDTVLPPIDRELAILIVLERHGGVYELVPHRRLALSLGLTDEQVAGVCDPLADGLYSDRQNAIRRFAERFAANPAEPTALPADNLEAYLDSRERVELGLSLVLYMGIAHFTSVIDVPREDPARFKAPPAKA